MTTGQAQQCTAKSKRTGERCKANAVTGKNVCYHHGGRSLSGTLAPRFKTGKYSKFLPTKLAANYAAALADPEWLALKDEIALTEARLSEALEKLTAGETPALLSELESAYGRLRVAIDSGNVQDVTTAVRDLSDLFARRATINGLWGEVDGLIEQRRRLSDTERKRLVDMQQVLTSQQALLLVGALMGVIKTHVTERRTLANIAADITRIIGGAGGADVADIGDP